MNTRVPRVLVIDDEELIGRVIGRVLRGAEVVAMTNPRAALALLRTAERFDLILCDVMMPDMTGFELYEQLQEQGSPHLESFCFMTGGAFTPRSARFLETVDARRVEKPVDGATLRALLTSRMAA